MRLNRQRQEVEAAILDTAFAAAELQAGAGRAALVVAGEGWHPGVVGIVAGRIKERFNRPACVAGIAEGTAKGSGRSVPGIDLGAAVIAARQAGILATGGGHPMAAGFSLSAGRGWRLSTPFWTNGCPPRRSCRRGRPGGRGHAGGAGGDHRAGDPCGPAGAVRRGQRGAGVRGAARPRGARRPGGTGRTTIRAFVEGEGGGRRLKAMLFRAGWRAGGRGCWAGGAPLHLAGHLRAEEWNGAWASDLR